MKPGRLSLTIALLSLTLVACAPHKPRVEITPDSTLQAGQFDSWGFAQPLALEQAGYPSETIAFFTNAVEAAMEQRGYRMVTHAEEQPELLINIAATISDQGDSGLQSDAYQAIHPPSGTFHNSWRGYGEGYGASTRQQRYGEGSVSIGVIHAGNRELLWESVATGRLSGKRSEAEQQELVDSVTHQMLALLPAAKP